jgi:hypothetical protein
MPFELILYTVTMLITSMLGAIGSILLTMRIQRWFTLLMTCGVVLALIMRTLMITVGTLQTVGKISVATYQKYSEFSSALAVIGNLCFGIGFLLTAMYLMQFLTPLIRKGSSGNRPYQHQK